MKGKDKNMRIGGVLAIVILMAMNGRAEKLAPNQWKVRDEASGKKVPAVTDNRLETAWTASGTHGLLIDLGEPTVLHRLYIAPGGGITNSYRQLTVSFMTEPAGTTVVHHYMTPTCEPWRVSAQRSALRASGTNDFLPSDKPEADLRFNPIVARYVRIEGAAPLAEVMVFGSAAREAFEKDAAVVVASNSPAILRVAAEDLRYYIGELTGRPLPIIDPAQEGAYPGTLYKIVDLAPLATNYAQMAANSAAGKLPNTEVNIEKQGREVLFRAWPHINVAYSVWEFLRQQGVTWAAPEDHADYVPTGKGVDLSRLPLRKSPSAKWREGLGGFSHGPVYWACFYMDDTLFAVRNGSEVGRLFPGLGTEMPANPDMQTRVTKAEDLKPEYREGFDGHPHNLHSVIPNRLLESNPEWCGMGPDGQRKPPSKGGPQTFCFTSPEVIKFVTDKMVYWSGDNTNCAATFRLVPSDGASFCLCERCLALCKPLERPVMAYCAGDYVMSGPYYYFITEVAKQVKVLRPKLRVFALAYSDYTPVPREIPTFPDNTTLQVCTYGHRNLPLTAPANAATRAYLEPWTTRGVPLSHWDYLLIHSEWRTLTMPVPMVTAIVDREQYLARLGMLDGLTQTDGGSFTHNPWNFYAFGRMLWDVSLTADRILDEFFTAYYQEAKTPMLAYYSALETHLIRNSVSLEDFAYDLGPNPAMFTPELVVTLRKQLAKARAAATTYYVKARVEQAASDLEWAIPAAARRSMDKAVALKSGKKEYVCQRRTGAIVVDGKLDDEGWKGVAAAGGFVKPNTFEPIQEKDRTEFRLAWDDTALYVAVRCANTNAANLKVSENVWGMDNFEFFFVPAASYTAGYYQAAVSAAGKAWGPQHFMGDYMWGKDLEAMPALDVAVQRGDGDWTCEFVVPFKTLKDAAPKAGDFWRVNMARGGASWSRLPIGNWHLYRDFDLITFAAAE